MNQWSVQHHLSPSLSLHLSSSLPRSQLLPTHVFLFALIHITLRYSTVKVKIHHQHQHQLEDPTTTYHDLITLQELAESHLLPSFSTFTTNYAFMNISFPCNSIPEPRRLAQISLGARVPCVTIAIAALLSSSRSLHKQGSYKISQFRSQLP